MFRSANFPVRRFVVHSAVTTLLLTPVVIGAERVDSAFAEVGGGGYGTCTGSGATFGCGVGVPGSPGDPGAPGGNPTPPSSGGDSGGGGGGSSPTSCTYTPTNNGPPPAGADPTGGWYLVVCTPSINTNPNMGGSAWSVQWVNGGAPAPPPPPPNPADVAATAESEISLPSPTISLAPATWGVVHLPEWLWIDASIWHPFTTSATACNAGGCVTATASALPQYVTWATGDGATLTCYGPGTPIDFSIPVSSQSTSCSHTWATTSAGQASATGSSNDAAFPISATVTWSGSWSAAGAASGAGSFGPLTTSASTSLRVEQIQAVNTDP